MSQNKSNHAPRYTVRYQNLEKQMDKHLNGLKGLSGEDLLQALAAE